MAGSLGERYNSSSGSRQSLAAKRILVQFTAQNLQICYSFTHVQIMHMSTRYYAQDALYAQDAYATFYNFFF